MQPRGGLSLIEIKARQKSRGQLCGTGGHSTSSNRDRGGRSVAASTTSASWECFG